MVSRAEKKLFLNAMVAETNDEPEGCEEKEEHEEDDDVSNALGDQELPHHTTHTSPHHHITPYHTTPRHTPLYE